MTHHIPKRMLNTFGFKHGKPVAGAQVRSDDQIIDLRDLGFRNPYSQLHLQTKTGLDLDIEKFIEDSKTFKTEYKSLILKVIRIHEKIIWIGCTGGRHRSVFLAEKLCRDMPSHFYIGIHRDI